MAVNILSSGRDAVSAFVYDHLFPTIIKPNCETRVNLELSFRDFLVDRGAPQTLADEHAEKWMTDLLTRVYVELSDWEALGLPRPIELTNESSTFATWRHPSYQAITGRAPLPLEFAEINEWICEQKEREFLFVAACYLKLVGANPIFITDTTGDGGIDIIGRISVGPLRSTALFIQAKTSSSRISANTVMLEYAKYLASARSKKFEEYRSALGFPLSRDGMGPIYLILSNNEFADSARQAAFELGILLRSRRQIALWLAERSTRSRLELVKTDIGTNLKADLTANIGSRLAL